MDRKFIPSVSQHFGLFSDVFVPVNLLRDEVDCFPGDLDLATDHHDFNFTVLFSDISGTF
jgi:hypothetical protein